MAGGIQRRGGKKNRKWGRNSRAPGDAGQWGRTFQNKLNRVNRDRAKSGKGPLAHLAGYDHIGKPEGR